MLRITYILLLFFGFPCAAEPVVYSSSYTISLRSISLAKADINLEITNQQYELSALFSSTGLGFFLSDDEALIVATGKITEGKLEPVFLRYSWTDKNGIKFVQLDYEAGSPKNYSSNYVPSSQRKALVPIRPEDVAAGTRDPFSAMLIAQNLDDGHAFCQLPVQIFDGRRLARLIPENKRNTDSVKDPGDIACSVRWEPIAGYSEKTHNRAKELLPVNFQYTNIAQSGLMAPREVKIVTRYGPVHISAVEPFSKSKVRTLPRKLDLSSRFDDDESIN